MSNAKGKGKRKGSATYAKFDRRARNKAARIARDAKRAKPQSCGHGVRHCTHEDGRCRRCFAAHAAPDGGDQ